MGRFFDGRIVKTNNGEVMNKTPVSVVVITKNEEDNLKECLESVMWANEIIVVDDESTDATLAIARQFTDKVFIRKMENEGKHRNWAYSQASNDWVISLDADERVMPELAEEITELLTSTPLNKAYTIPRRNYIGDYWLRWGGEYPAAQLRLFLKDEFKYEEVEVHPRAFLDGECGHLTTDIIHYSHRDITDYLRSLNNHTSLEAKKWYITGRKMSLGHAVWRTLDRCFYRRLLRKKGYKDGIYGLAVAVFSGFYQIVSYLKYREIMLKDGQTGQKSD
jgi:glycosyltransferase involved in cell wall biosynthesis